MTTAPNSKELWGFEAPVLPVLDNSKREAFFNSAPAGTVVEFYDDLYLKLHHGDWRHLEELVSAGSAYLNYETWETSTSEAMFKYVTSDNTVIRVLRLGSTEGEAF